MGHTYPKELLLVHLQFKYNCILTSNPERRCSNNPCLQDNTIVCEKVFIIGKRVRTNERNQKGQKGREEAPRFGAGSVSPQQDRELNSLTHQQPPRALPDA